MSLSIDDLENTEQAEEMAETVVEEREAKREAAAEAAEVQRDLETAPEQGEPALDEERFEMTDKRRIGSMSLTVDGDVVRFGKLSGFAAAELDETLERLRDSEASTRQILEWCAGTLEEWCLDDDRDVEHWGHNHTLTELITFVRRLTLGGNPSLES